MLTKRTKLSLCQYLSLEDHSAVHILMEKHGLLGEYDGAYSFHGDVQAALRAVLLVAPEDRVQELLAEVVLTEPESAWRAEKTWKLSAHLARWADLLRCLLLDNYRVEQGRLIAVDPSIAGAQPLEDDLTTELKKSGLTDADEIVRAFERSADDFRRTPPDYNGCLSNVRVALQTLGTAIAKKRQAKHGGSFIQSKWGQVLAYLRTSGLITPDEEGLITATYGFISPGSHTPVGLTQEEMVRLGRNMAVSMCYFLVKRHNGSP